MGVFRKTDKIGKQKTITRNVKGNKRKLTYKKVRSFGKNKNLRHKIIKNQPA